MDPATTSALSSSLTSKKLFTISDAGEFDDGIYREQAANGLFGRFIGRSTVSVHEKATFTSADITFQGYLYKRGSWFKSWKKRYFILRKDIHALSYFPSAESMTLLGSIKLERGSSIEYVHPNDVDGMSNVMAIRQTPDETLDKAVLIRAEDTEDMIKWTQKILTEIFRHRTSEANMDDAVPTDRWVALFDSAQTIESTNKPRRGAATVGKHKEHHHSATKEAPLPLPSAPRTAKQIETKTNIASVFAAAEQGIITDDGVEGLARVKGGGSTVSVSSAHIDDVNSLPVVLLSEGLSNIDLVGMDLPPVDSDDDDEIEDTKPATSTIRNVRSHSEGGHTVRNNSGEGREKDEPHIATINRSVSQPATALHRRTPRKIRKMKREKKEKPEKKPGPPPFTHVAADRFATPSEKMVGYQFGLQLENSCGFLDKISVYIYTSSSGSNVPEGAGRPAMDANDMYLASTVGQTGSAAYGAGAVLKSSLDWTLRAQTEPLTVLDRPEYGRTTVDKINLHFSLVQCVFPEDVDLVLVQVFKLDAGNAEDVKLKEGAKIKPGEVSSNMSKVSSCMFNRKAMEDRSGSVFKVHMKVVVSTTVDISNPIDVHPKATLGVVRMSSSALFAQRKWLTNSLKMKPYSEVMYSFATSTGQTLSLEQLFASPYPTMVAEALGSLFLGERRPIVNTLLSILEDEEEHTKQQIDSTTGSADGDESLSALAAKHEVLLESLDVLDAVGADILMPLEEVVDFVGSVADGKEDVRSKVIGAEVGGCFLRRSIWKKDEKWQYSTVNLNVHMMTSQHFTFSELTATLSKRKKSSRDPLHIVPTITLGCPAAHVLKYTDGGLRRIFGGVNSDLRKLIWMQAVQSPYFSEMLSVLFDLYPKDAASLFGVTAGVLHNHAVVATITKRRLELAQRLDMVGCQALGFAVTCIRTILTLATRNGGHFFDVLARSLKIGFLLCLQSLLSTQGDEMGMVEDLDIASLWLHLVTVRLVTYPEHSSSAPANPVAVNDETIPIPAVVVEATQIPEIRPRRLDMQDLIIRRDVNGRIVVDIAITEEEAATVRSAQESLAGFEYQGFMPFSIFGESMQDPNFHVPVQFSLNPDVKDTDGCEPTVHAVSEICSVAFSQGVNEMQTLANMSNAKEIFRQVEMNLGSMNRIKEYQARFLRVFQYQVTMRADEIAGESAAEQQALNRSVRALTRTSTITVNDNAAGIIIDGFIEAMKRMFEDASLAISNAAQSPNDKHVHVLLKTSALCREIGGTIGILCKSGKDRTSMGVTLEIARSLVEQLGAQNGMEICQVLRMHGCRRMNVYANTGQPMYAFNSLQRLALPMCYRPPAAACSGSVNS